MKRQWILGLVLAALALAGSASLSGCGLTDNGGSGGDPDSGTDDGTTIYDLRQGAVAADSTVTLGDVVVTTPIHTDSSKVWVEEPEGGQYSGIILYLYSDVLLGVSLAPGDLISVTGMYSEFYEVSEITVTDATAITVLGTAAVPAPAVVAPTDLVAGAATAEAYESVLIRVESIAVTNPDLGYGEFEVTGGLPVDDFFFATGAGPSGGNIIPADGETFTAINGVLGFTNFNDTDGNPVPEYKLMPRTLADYEGYTGAIDTDTDTTPQEVTIGDIQQGDVASGDNVILTDVIVTSPLTFDGTGFFVEEAAGGEYSGIFVYNYNGATDPAVVAVGDVVTITGGFSEFNGCSEVTIDASTAVEVTSSGAAVPTPVAIADASTIATGGADAEKYEGVLVTVSGLTVTTAVNTYGEIVVNDSLMVGSMFLDAFLEPAVGDTYTSITGPLHYSYDNFKLEPRDDADLVP
jgi:DNA/RNA endonuclease YhcR with UshA esterase domain